MKIGSLELHNFMLYPKLKKRFGDKNIIGILAEYEENKDKSNKGGKSTIPEAILYCLTGDSRAVKEVELIHHGQSEMWVKVVLIEGDKKYSILRGRDIKNKGLLEINGVDKKKEAQQIIDDLIGMNRNEFVLTRFFKQFEINQFMELKPAQKQEYLMRWLKNDYWQKLERSVLDDLNVKLKKLELYKTKKSTYAEQLNSLKSSVGSIESLKKVIKNYQFKKNKWIKKLKNLKVSSNEANNLNTNIDIINAKIGDLKNKITNDYFKASPKDEEKLRLRCSKLTIRILNIQQRLADTDGHTGFCPILKESCDRIETSKDEIKKLKKDVKLLKIKLTSYNSKLYQIKNYQKRLLLLDKITDLEQQKNKYENRLFIFDKHEAFEIENKIQSFDVHLNKSTILLVRAEESKTSKEKLKEKIESLNKKISKAQKKVALLKYIAFMFGKNGIPSQEIENAFEEIEDEINYILEQFGTPLQVEFQADRELSTFEDKCIQCGWVFPRGTRIKECKSCDADRRKKRKEEINFKILENGEEEGFHMESGGGKIIISIATRIAITCLQQRQTGSNFNVLFLDEPDTAFDSVNRNNFIGLITKTLINKLGFEQIFWISHFKDIQESVPNILKVKRYKTYSKAIWI